MSNKERITADPRSEREVLDDIEQRGIRVETKLSRLLEAQGLGFDGRKPPTPPRAYKETLPLNLDHTEHPH